MIHSQTAILNHLRVRMLYFCEICFYIKLHLGLQILYFTFPFLKVKTFILQHFHQNQWTHVTHHHVVQILSVMKESVHAYPSTKEIHILDVALNVY